MVPMLNRVDKTMPLDDQQAFLDALALERQACVAELTRLTEAQDQQRISACLARIDEINRAMMQLAGGRVAPRQLLPQA